VLAGQPVAVAELVVDVQFVLVLHDVLTEEFQTLENSRGFNHVAKDKRDARMRFEHEVNRVKHVFVFSHLLH
jgi:hypothetical protein